MAASGLDTSSSSSSTWLRVAAVAAGATLTAGAGYVIYKYVLLPALEPEPEEIEEAPASLQALLTGGAAGSTTRGATSTPALPVRKTPAPAPAKPRGGPALPPRKASPTGPAKPAADTASSAGPSTTEAAPAAASTSAAVTSKAAAASANLKACACCSKPISGLPLRCSKCKAVYYCSQPCQKKHWTEHKSSCAKGDTDGSDGGAAAAATAGTSSSPSEEEAVSSPADTTTSAAAAAAAAAATDADADVDAKEESSDAAAAASGESTSTVTVTEARAATATPASEEGATEASSAGAGETPAGAAHGGLQSALVEVLRQAAAKGAGTLDGAFEEAVMHFLGGKLPTALAAFTALQAAARAESPPRSDLVLELHKWLGHTNTKLGNFNAAADAFSAGVEESKAAGNTAARVDNAIGLGNLWKMAGQLTKAAEVLKEALMVAQEVDSAGMQSEVLVALGNVVMSVDPEEGLACLQIAVKLREDEVAKAAETGDRAAMATGMMQAAAAMVNMAAALFATRRFEQSKQAYEQAMEIFELMEDHEKVIQVLINLANLAELQLNQPQEALEIRKKLSASLKEVGHPGIAGGAATAPCGVCKKPIGVTRARGRNDDTGAIVILGCLHVQHDACFKDHCDASKESSAAAAAAAVAASAAQGGEEAAAVAAAAASPGAKRTTTCPTCKAPVPVMA